MQYIQMIEDLKAQLLKLGFNNGLERELRVVFVFFLTIVPFPIGWQRVAISFRMLSISKSWTRIAAIRFSITIPYYVKRQQSLGRRSTR